MVVTALRLCIKPKRTKECTCQKAKLTQHKQKHSKPPTELTLQQVNGHKLVPEGSQKSFPLAGRLIKDHTYIFSLRISKSRSRLRTSRCALRKQPPATKTILKGVGVDVSCVPLKTMTDFCMKSLHFLAYSMSISNYGHYGKL